MNRDSKTLTPFILLFLTGFIAACDPGEPPPRLHTLHPMPVVQGERVVLFGESLGSFDPRHSIRVGVSCADPVFWADDAIAFTVPTAIGVGHQNVIIRWVDGRELRFNIHITGDDLPPGEQACKRGLVSNLPPLPEPDVISPPDDANNTDSSNTLDGTSTIDAGLVDSGP